MNCEMKMENEREGGVNRKFTVEIEEGEKEKEMEWEEGGRRRHG